MLAGSMPCLCLTGLKLQMELGVFKIGTKKDIA